MVSFTEWTADVDVTKRELKTEIALVPSDFEEFRVEKNEELTINFKELKVCWDARANENNKVIYIDTLFSSRREFSAFPIKLSKRSRFTLIAPAHP